MAPARDLTFPKDEKVLCFHHELLYEAKVLDSKLSNPSDKKSSLLYRVHYKGWKNTWDDWVPADRLKKYNDENLQLARGMKSMLDDTRRSAQPKSIKKRTAETDLSSNRASEDRQIPSIATGRAQKRAREYEIEKEETFLTRPAVRLPLPDHLKSILVDDWEFVTKNLSLVSLPSQTPVNSILDAYFDEEKKNRRLGSAEADLLEEVIMGMKDYFELCLGRALLYRFERQQYYEIKKGIEKNEGEYRGKGTIAHLPELISQTNMDAQSVRKLKEEVQALANWLNKNSARFFTQPYEVASAEYIEASRGL
ncbi:uncharacterized protein KY384_004313 [Bacidia gigantensis]|uniref:uncharacterized protein n=1 Tax=Bacidia gigantensis TaxID=2732470 RepID=UPI001D0446D1|nr:uncharacterized protein KY384_004313 [Bacidia gigantensis]KAG8530956.1 hypothetical protein KY384_004313 [Bacidia gigantensis]